MLTDLETAAAELNAAFVAAKCPLTAAAGKRAIKFYKHYTFDGKAGYLIGRKEAVNVARYYEIKL